MYNVENIIGKVVLEDASIDLDKLVKLKMAVKSEAMLHEAIDKLLQLCKEKEAIITDKQ